MATFAVILVAYVSATTIHELGHALACILLRLPIERFAVWPLSLGRKGNSWKLTIWPRSWIAGSSGFVRFWPIRSKGLRVRMVAVLLAGPLASALAVYLCFSIRESFAASTNWSDFVNVLGLTALLQVTNILPLKSRTGAATDGRRIWELIRSWNELSEREALQSFSSQLTERRPRDWDPDLVHLVIRTPGPGTERYKNWLKYKWCADTGRLVEARAALDWAIAHQEDGEPFFTLWECVWFEAFATRDLGAAQQRLGVAQNCPPARTNLLYRWRALAALAALEGRAEDAASAAEKARECLTQAAAPKSALAAVFESELTEVLSRSPNQPIVTKSPP